MPFNPSKDWSIKLNPDKREDAYIFLATVILHQVRISNTILYEIYKSISNKTSKEAKDFFKETSEKMYTEIGLELTPFGEVTSPKNPNSSGRTS